jgi:pyruvate/2-oxoglutarate/acetoin dehydrogenase E1 component
VTPTTKISYAQALSEAIRMEMHRSPEVVCVASDGAAARSPITADLATAFGSERIIKLEANVRPVSVAVGMAARGMRVICEARTAQLGPEALAPLSELDPGAPGSVVLRIPDGGPEPGGLALSPIEGRLLDTPHASLVAPATPADAKGMMVGCIRASGSHCVLESEPLYASVGDVPEGSHLVQSGTATIEAWGERPKLSIIAYGAGARLADRALQTAGVDAELIDLRSLRPLDRQALTSSIGRTGKAVVIEPEGSTRVGAEVAALLMAHAFEYLDGPLTRIALAPGDEDAARLAEGIEDLARY